jgi:hypothetical protein
MFKRTAGVSCSLKESIDGLEIIVIFNVLKEYCIPKEEDNITSDQWHAYMI